MKKSTRDHYQVLEVSPDASREEIREQFHLLIRFYHPDNFARSGDDKKRYAEAKSKQINLAWEVLSDPVKRRVYDRERSCSGSMDGPEQRRDDMAEGNGRKEEEAKRRQAEEDRRNRQAAEASARRTREAVESRRRRAEEELRKKQETEASADWLREDAETKRHAADLERWSKKANERAKVARLAARGGFWGFYFKLGRFRFHAVLALYTLGLVLLPLTRHMLFTILDSDARWKSMLLFVLLYSPVWILFAIDEMLIEKVPEPENQVEPTEVPWSKRSPDPHSLLRTVVFTLLLGLLFCGGLVLVFYWQN